MTRRATALLAAFAAAVTILGPVAGASPAEAAGRHSIHSTLSSVRFVTVYHVPVLMYHRIAPASERGADLPDLVVDPQLFDAQLRALASRGWRTITAGQLIAAMSSRRPVAAGTFVITIDDGRDDGYRYGLPILRRYGLSATYFVITARVGRAGYLDWAQLATLRSNGMEIGNHTASHLDMRAFSRAQTDAQVDLAQTAIASHLGVTPISFAYPFGYTPANVVASVRAAGLRIAFTTQPGARETIATALALPRIKVHPTTTASQLVATLAPSR